MGVDISGAIECRPVFDFPPGPAVTWQYSIDLGQLHCLRSYDAFGCLFGVTNYAGFEPVAADRGLPSDVSARTADASAGWAFFSATWISWAEVAAIDWDEPASRPDARIHWYTRGDDGTWRPGGKAAQDPTFAEHVGLSAAEAAERTWPAGTQWLIGDRLYRSEILTRKDAVRPGGEWEPVWSVMTALAGLHGGDNVRLVAWFDR